MPINLRYGQQAVARSFITSQRLQQVLAKQRQLAEQGKKVSVRMILEKAKLLDTDQLAQVDRDLNIKVIKKRTGQIQRPGVKEPPAQPGPTDASNFAGESPPQFSGMQGANPDATVFSPPPADMQDKINSEREKSKQDPLQQQEAASFMNDDSGSPFGEDPFSGGDMAPQPADEMQPEPMGDDPFGQEMSPEPIGNAGADLQPDQGGFDDDDGSPFGENPFANQDMAPVGNEPSELDRMDSSPKLSSLAAEQDGFSSPEDEELPSINAGFDDDPHPSQAQDDWGHQAPQPSADLSPDADENFADFGEDIRSPEELESSPGPSSGPGMDATMFSPRPDNMPGGREKTGAMDRTVFSPRPPEMGGPPPADVPPEKDNWGQDVPGDEATMYSPSPPGTPGGDPAQGRKGTDDFGDVDLPTGKVIDDVPTEPASMDEDIHPIRRGVGTSSASVNKGTGRAGDSNFGEDIADELPSDDIDVDENRRTSKPKLPQKGGLPPRGGAKPTKSPEGRKEKPKKAPKSGSEKKEKKGTGKRVMLFFVFLLLITLAILILPIALYDHVPEVRPLRDNLQAAPIYDYVEDIYRQIPGLPPEWAPQLPEPDAQPEMPAPDPDAAGETEPDDNVG